MYVITEIYGDNHRLTWTRGFKDLDMAIDAVRAEVVAQCHRDKQNFSDAEMRISDPVAGQYQVTHDRIQGEWLIGKVFTRLEDCEDDSSS